MTLQSLIAKAYVAGSPAITFYLEKILSERKQSIIIYHDDKYVYDSGIVKFLKDNTFCFTWPEGNAFQAFFGDDLEETLLQLNFNHNEE